MTTKSEAEVLEYLESEEFDTRDGENVYAYAVEFVRAYQNELTTNTVKEIAIDLGLDFDLLVGSI